MEFHLGGIRGFFILKELYLKLVQQICCIFRKSVSYLYHEVERGRANNETLSRQLILQFINSKVPHHD